MQTEDRGHTETSEAMQDGTEIDATTKYNSRLQIAIIAFNNLNSFIYPQKLSKEFTVKLGYLLIYLN